MEEIIDFKRNILENTFLSFVNEFSKKSEEFKQNFIENLIQKNLDIFFFQALKELDHLNILDSTLLERLKQEFILEKGRDEFYKVQFRQIIEKSKYPILLLKGWQLRDLLKLDLYKRSCDVDLLVLEEHFDQTILFLKSNFNFFSKPYYIAYGQECLLNENSMCIDLHKGLIAVKSYDSILKLSAKELFKEAQVNEIKNSKYYTFNLEMELIHLCIHFLIHHRGVDFILVYELRCFLNLYLKEVDLNKLVKIAEKHCCLPVIIYSFLIINTLCHLSKSDSQMIDMFIEENDVNTEVRTLFDEEFNISNFYIDIGISKRTLKKLLVKNLEERIVFFTANLNFRTQSFFKYINQVLKPV